MPNRLITPQEFKRDVLDIARREFTAGQFKSHRDLIHAQIAAWCGDYPTAVKLMRKWRSKRRRQNDGQGKG